MKTEINQEAYHLSKRTLSSFDETVEKVTGALKEEGFGVITTINLTDIFKNKLNVDFRKYIILGACNPKFAYEALLEEDKVGVFLPCNVVVQELDSREVEVSIIDPVEMMRPINNLNLKTFATQLKQSMDQVLQKIDG